MTKILKIKPQITKEKNKCYTIGKKGVNSWKKLIIRKFIKDLD